MRLLVCGSRHWADREALRRYLDEFHATRPVGVLVEGEQRGADLMAREWAEDRGVAVLPFEARWRQHGAAAGPIRNRAMLIEGRPDAVVAFHDNIAESTGTANMLRLAKQAGVPYVVVRHQQHVETRSDAPEAHRQAGGL